MWQLIRAKPTDDRHVHCDEPVIEFTRWTLSEFTVPAVELCEVDGEPMEVVARAA